MRNYCFILQGQLGLFGFAETEEKSRYMEPDYTVYRVSCIMADGFLILNGLMIFTSVHQGLLEYCSYRICRICHCCGISV